MISGKQICYERFCNVWWKPGACKCRISSKNSRKRSSLNILVNEKINVIVTTSQYVLWSLIALRYSLARSQIDLKQSLALSSCGCGLVATVSLERRQKSRKTYKVEDFSSEIHSLLKGIKSRPFEQFFKISTVGFESSFELTETLRCRDRSREIVRKAGKSLWFAQHL